MVSINKIVRGIPQGLRAVEIVLGENVAGLVSMFGGILPAGIAFEGMRGVLGMPQWLAWAGVVIIEGLNLGATSTALLLWKKKQMARFWIALGAVLFYLVSVITVNVILDDGPATHKWAKGLLSSVSVVGAVVVALRIGIREDDERNQAKIRREAEAKEQEIAHARKLEEERIAYEREIQKAKLEARRLAAAERRQHKHALEMEKLKVSESFGGAESFLKVAESSSGKEKYPGTFEKWRDWRKVPADEREKIAAFETWEEVAERYGRPEKTAKAWLRNAKELYPAPYPPTGTFPRVGKEEQVSDE